MTRPEAGAVLGIDVGCSPKRRTSAVCRLDWTASTIAWSIARFRALDDERDRTIAEVAGNRPQLCVAIDGPLRAGFDIIGTYRTAERMLSRGLPAHIGKPGQSSTPVGMRLNEHANACALAALRTRLVAPATWPVRIDAAAVVEAFPTTFLGLMLDEPKRLKTSRARRSDDYFVHLSENGALAALLRQLLPGRNLQSGLAVVRNHDDRAALVCALAALAVACGDFTAVGDQDGWIILPPRRAIRDWAWRLLEANADPPTHLYEAGAG